jgi:hypothetical protein
MDARGVNIKKQTKSLKRFLLSFVDNGLNNHFLLKEETTYFLNTKLRNFKFLSYLIKRFRHLFDAT